MSKEARWWNQVPEREDAPAVMSDERILGGHTPQRTIVVVQRADRDHGDGFGVMSHTSWPLGGDSRFSSTRATPAFFMDVT